jgi:hypothetical protein
MQGILVACCLKISMLFAVRKEWSRISGVVAFFNQRERPISIISWTKLTLFRLSGGFVC